MRVPFSFLTEQFSDPEPIFERIRGFLKRCDFTLGEDLQEFEGKYAKFTGAKHAIGVGTGTDALSLSLRVLGVGPGDEVISPPNSFVATTGAIVQAGATPIYVDSGADQTIDCALIERAITPKTKAIIPVHWAGAAADMVRICEIARAYQLYVVEDACQALGAQVQGKGVGTFGHTGAFSAHPLKPLHVWGDGGMIVTNDDAVADKLRLMRNHGLSGRDEVAMWGVNSRFDNLHAIVGNYVFENLDETVDKRIANAAYFDRAFTQGSLADKLRLPERHANRKHVFHLYILEAENRDGLLKFLNAKGVEAKIHYPIPLHLQPAAKPFGYKAGDFPRAERQGTHTLTLPCHQYLNHAHLQYTVDCIQEFYRS